MNPYARQTILPDVGEAGQSRLAAGHVLVVGAGGLGSPVLQYLTGAGIGRITLVDSDTVAEHNLHRQPLYRMSDIGNPKAEVAARALQALNPQTEIVPVVDWFDCANAAGHLDGVALALDCADTFAVSYTLSDVCSEIGLPLISASALGLVGYVGGYCGGTPSLRAVFPDLPDRAASCDTAGVMGPVVGMLGGLQAQTTLSVLLNFKPSPLGQVVTFDTQTWRFGGFRFERAPELSGPRLRFIAESEIGPDDLVIDLRGMEEAPKPAAPHALRLSVDAVAGLPVPEENRRVALCCRTGVRAWRAGRALQSHWPGDIVLVAIERSMI